jgi:hypothetical protein
MKNTILLVLLVLLNFPIVSKAGDDCLDTVKASILRNIELATGEGMFAENVRDIGVSLAWPQSKDGVSAVAFRFTADDSALVTNPKKGVLFVGVQLVYLDSCEFSSFAFGKTEELK